MRKRRLTDKQKCVLDLEARGKDRNDAVLRCYKAKNRAVAYQISFKLGKSDLYNTELKKQIDLFNEVRMDEGRKFADILKELISPREVANILKELIKSTDKRARLQAVQEYNKVLDHYPDKKIGIYRDLENETKQLYTEADIQRIENGEYEEAPIPAIKEPEEPEAIKE